MQINQIVQPILALPRITKRAIAILVDVALCAITVWLALFLRLGVWVPLSGDVWPAVVVSVVLAIPIFVIFGLYRTVFRFASGDALGAVAAATAVYGLIYAAACTAFGLPGVPRTVGIIQPILLLLFMGASRMFARYWLSGQYRRRLRREQKKNVLIYGAGLAGRQLAAALSDSFDTKVVGFIDDERGLHGSVIDGVRIGGPEDIANLLEEQEVVEIYLAIPSANRRRRNEILKMIGSLEVAVRTLPGLLEIASGKVTMSDLRPLEVEDLLGRDPVSPDQAVLEANIRDRVVLVTGAGGSIGSELCRQILNSGPRKLLLVEISEFALFTIHRELTRIDSTSGERPIEIVPLLGSACDAQRMQKIFALWRPDTVYHAAAYKHVPLVEHNLIEGVRNNVFGTWVCAQAAIEHGTSRFVLISTDKAVRPTNVMGASKRLAEMILQTFAAQGHQTCFAMVRFGNVLGSSGSVVPVFRQQIAAGGPVTVTHRDVTRYFMTIPEATQLVLQAGAMARGGEVFVLDMGEPVRIADLAVRMIELSGLRVRSEQHSDGDIEITYVGLRPGEKLYEELLIGADPVPTSHPRIMMANERCAPADFIVASLAVMGEAIAAHDVDLVRRTLTQLVHEYKAADEIVDWIAREEAIIASAPRSTQISKAS